jgi:3-deoxy-D-manno-octulosonate 8-phosphate phosphatase KdsC-like HAD superfamily phosphatase
MAAAPPGLVRQARYTRLLRGRRRCTELVHGWFASALELETVSNPRLLLSLDVDGVLEIETAGFSSTSLAGAAALKLLQLGRVAVILNTARSLSEVRQRVEQLGLLGGVAGFGTWSHDAVFGRDECLVGSPALESLQRLRSHLRIDPGVVLDGDEQVNVRASRFEDGELVPITGTDSRRLLDRLELDSLTYWVAPHHTDFCDRHVDKGAGIERLQSALGLDSLPLAAMGDSACDLPMLRRARFAFLPAATLPSYTPLRGQRLYRARMLGPGAVWEAACVLVPDAALQRSVLASVRALEVPEWIPESLRQLPVAGRGLLPRLAAALPISR